MHSEHIEFHLNMDKSPMSALKQASFKRGTLLITYAILASFDADDKAQMSALQWGKPGEYAGRSSRSAWSASKTSNGETWKPGTC
jgi:hypothetical protein